MKKNLKINKTKLLIAIGMLGLTSVGNAQWAVTNVNDPLYFGPTGIFTQMMGQMFNTLKASVDQVAALSEVSRKQNAQNQEDTDSRMRAALGQANIAAYNMTLVPTLQACAEYTQRGTGAAAVRASMSGGGGGSGKYTPAAKAAAVITSEASKAAEMIGQKNNLGTCSEADVKGNIAGCTAVGNFGGGTKTVAADTASLSLKANMSNKDKVDKAQQDFANLTLDKDAYDVTNQYIRNATLYNAPKMLPDDKLKTNPAYKSSYDSIMIKLNAAQQAMIDIASMRKAAGVNPSALAGKYWQENSTAYKDLLGMNPPQDPSLTELLNFNVLNEVFGVPKNTAKGQEELLKDLNTKIALNNLIAFKQLSQQENTNILLSLLLTQSVTPASLAQLNDNYDAAMRTGK